MTDKQSDQESEVRVATAGQQQTMSDAAYSGLRRMIIELSLAPGVLISEPELSLSQGYSRASTRAALLRLAQEGLVRPIARQGYEVSPMSVQDAYDVFDVRLALEPYAAARAAGRVRPHDFEGLADAYVAGYDLAMPGTLSVYLAANRRFRLIPALATGNPRLIMTIAANLDEVERYLRLGFMVHENRSGEIRLGYEDLTSALLAGETEVARKLIESQLMRTRERVLEALLSRPEIQRQPLTHI